MTQAFEITADDAVVAVALSKNLQQLLVGTLKGTVTVWDVKKRELMTSMRP
jgi:hypothetical protein